MQKIALFAWGQLLDLPGVAVSPPLLPLSSFPTPAGEVKGPLLVGQIPKEACFYMTAAFDCFYSCYNNTQSQASIA